MVVVVGSVGVVVGPVGVIVPPPVSVVEPVSVGACQYAGMSFDELEQPANANASPSAATNADNLKSFFMIFSYYPARPTADIFQNKEARGARTIPSPASRAKFQAFKDYSSID